MSSLEVRTPSIGVRGVLRGLVVLCSLSVVGLVSQPAPACSPSSTETSLDAIRDQIVLTELAPPEVGEITWTLNEAGGCGGGGDDCSFGSVEVEVLYGSFDYAAVEAPSLHYTRYFKPSYQGAGASGIEFGSEEAQWFRDGGLEIELSVIVGMSRTRSVRVVIPPAPTEG
ncbi:MAG: hypothetical protein KC933_26895 [Myxococcales bacterium]|nr:hypothetical protein [Myxococcales bacterium]